MDQRFSRRRDRWTPPKHPEWLQRVNDEGAHMDIKGIVPLDADSLINTATENTGLSYFGADDWHEPLVRLTRSFDTESELTLWGRIATRADMLYFLEARLRIEAAFKDNPEIASEVIERPLMIIGQGRSGTSFLHNLLAEDPSSRTVATWEVLFPTARLDLDEESFLKLRSRADHLVDQINRVIPEVGSMHEFNAELPADCAFIHCLTFNSPAWFVAMQGQAPSYVQHVLRLPVEPVYQYEKKLLQLLQWRQPKKRWVLKSPYSVFHIPDVLRVFPDMHFVWPHRDPVKALSSMVDLVGLHFWSRSDHPFIGDSMDGYTNADASAAMLAKPIEWLQDGTLPNSSLLNVRYDDLVRDPDETARRIYSFAGMNLSADAEQAFQNYLMRNPRSSRPVHQYQIGSDVEISEERALFKEYQDYFDVPSEV